jgi:hypothetical protein
MSAHRQEDGIFYLNNDALTHLRIAAYQFLGL